MPTLRIETGPQKGQKLLLRPPGPVLIGRDLEADFALFDRRSSRRHFRIDFLDEGYRLADLSSRSGTFVNEAKVRAARLRHGDQIVAGATHMVFEVDRPDDPLVGRDLGGYRILEAVGSGGMGTVYRALQLSLQRVVALKVLSEQLSKDEDFCRLFVEEARAAAEISHPHVVRVYDVNLTGGVLFYAMEFMAHGSVGDQCRHRGPLPLVDALKIAMDACAGLEFAHRKGIVHRDIKPSNLLIHENGAVKLADLGISGRIRDRGQSQHISGLSGSPHYMSPEQALGREMDGRSDVYSLGVTLFQMLAGRTPFGGDSVKDILLAHVRDEPPSLLDLCPEAPRSLSDLLRIALAKDPADRPQSATAFSRLLGDIRTEALAAPPQVSEAEPRRWTRRTFQAGVVAAALAVGFVSGNVLRYVRRKIREGGRRVERVRHIIAETRERLQAGDVAGAKRKFAELDGVEVPPAEWEFLRREIEPVRAALRAAESRKEAPSGGLH